LQLKPGLTGEAQAVVTEADTAARVGSGGLPVLATPRMLALMEQAAFQAVEPHLNPGETTVGTLAEIRHLAATPVGMRVRALARLEEVDGRRLRFQVEAFDERGPIGSGIHERFIVQSERFLARAEARRQQPQS